jgi:putative oxidoreductase
MSYTNAFSEHGVDARSAAYAATLLRAALGAMWVSHAMLKVFVFTLAGAAQFFESVGLPGILVYPVVAAEFAGGIAILLGYKGRIVSGALLPILFVAAWVHWPNGWVFTASGGGWEYPVFLAVVSLAHILIGDGAFSIGQARKPAVLRMA